MSDGRSDFGAYSACSAFCFFPTSILLSHFLSSREEQFFNRQIAPTGGQDASELPSKLLTEQRWLLLLSPLRVLTAHRQAQRSRRPFWLAQPELLATRFAIKYSILPLHVRECGHMSMYDYAHGL
ncbi:unnamed protein product [Protopolystoma xenopodis]|uniref:Uncharacterized protein n=1 Tax=Protopolystoma xenopodis TaxID=117903 RepID=A0A3S5FH85_9PLAT|nr:unnamed protein product [Protopolystoma xenopodis]